MDRDRLHVPVYPPLLPSFIVFLFLVRACFTFLQQVQTETIRVRGQQTHDMTQMSPAHENRGCDLRNTSLTPYREAVGKRNDRKVLEYRNIFLFRLYLHPRRFSEARHLDHATEFQEIGKVWSAEYQHLWYTNALEQTL